MKELDYICVFQCVLCHLPLLPSPPPPPPVKFYAGPNTSDPWQLSHSGWRRDRDLAQAPWKAALPGNTVGNPERDVLWGPWLCLGSHPPGKSSFMWAAPHAGPKEERDERVRTDTQAETRKRGQDQPSSNGHDLNPRLPRWERTPGCRCQREAEVSCSPQLSGQTVTPQRAPMPLISRLQRPTNCFSLWDLAYTQWLRGERGSDQGSRLSCRGSGSPPLKTPQPRPRSALLAFRLGLTMILIWPQMKEKKRNKRKGKKLHIETFKDTDT